MWRKRAKLRRAGEGAAGAAGVGGAGGGGGVAEAGEVAAGEVAGDGVGGIGRGERGAEDGEGVAAEGFGGHGRGGVEFEGCDSPRRRRGGAEISAECGATDELRGGTGWEIRQSGLDAEARKKKSPSFARIGRLKPAPPRQVSAELMPRRRRGGMGWETRGQTCPHEWGHGS